MRIGRVGVSLVACAVLLSTSYLQDGVWNGERILPEDYRKFVRTAAPGWSADKRPVYGGFFWINNQDAFPVPRDAYYMAGAGNQTTLTFRPTISSWCALAPTRAARSARRDSRRRSRC
jgi:hypothetical protein